MTSPLRLVIFDVDGTLVDSQGHIVASMTMAFNALGVAVPDRAAILGIVGLSLEVAMPVLAPALTPTQHAALVQGYKDSLHAASGPWRRRGVAAVSRRVGNLAKAAPARRHPAGHRHRQIQTRP